MVRRGVVHVDSLGQLPIVAAVPRLHGALVEYILCLWFLLVGYGTYVLRACLMDTRYTRLWSISMLVGSWLGLYAFRGPPTANARRSTRVTRRREEGFHPNDLWLDKVCID